MRTLVYCCDRCRRDYQHGQTLEIITGREPDPSGNGYIAVTKTMDLCVLCLAFYVGYAMEKGATQDIGKALL